jgi:hypothetical protein
VAGQRRVNGVEAMIVDTTSLSVMVQSIGVPHKDGDKVRTCLSASHTVQMCRASFEYRKGLSPAPSNSECTIKTPSYH